MLEIQITLNLFLLNNLFLNDAYNKQLNNGYKNICSGVFSSFDLHIIEWHQYENKLAER